MEEYDKQNGEGAGRKFSAISKDFLAYGPFVSCRKGNGGIYYGGGSDHKGMQRKSRGCQQKTGPENDGRSGLQPAARNWSGVRERGKTSRRQLNEL